MPKQVGQRIATLRKGKGWGQAKLAEIVTGAPRPATASDWETGKKMPDARNLAGLARAFGVTSDWLLFGGKDQEPVAAEPISDTERKELLGMLDQVRDAVAKGATREREQTPAPGFEGRTLPKKEDGGGQEGLGGG